MKRYDTMQIFFETLYGNERLKDQISHSILSKKLTHAYLLEGPQGSGKMTFATLIACALCDTDYTENDSNIQSETYKKIVSDTSPDVYRITAENNRKTIGVETIRFIKEQAYIKPNELEYKVFIIKDAHIMTTEAQNAFLKLLEEPPSYVIFLLLCENTRNLLPTVKSRVFSLKMELFSEKQLDDYLCHHIKQAQKVKEQNPELYKKVLLLSGGCIGEAQKRLKSMNGENSLYSKAQSILETMTQPILSQEKLISQLVLSTAKREELDEILECLQLAFRDIAAAHSHFDQMYFYLDSSIPQKASSLFSHVSLIKIFELLTKTREQITQNANLYLLQLNFSIAFYQIRKSMKPKGVPHER